MYRIGVDVGGTNTDAVLLQELEVVASVKTPTTSDITSGVTNAVGQLLERCPESRARLLRVTVGSTHFINAVLQARGLRRVSVIRLAGPCAEPLPPYCQFPPALAAVLRAPCLAANGGYNFDGSIITELDQAEVEAFVRRQAAAGIRHFVVSGAFSPVCADQETAVGAWVTCACPEASLTLSHTVGQLGLLSRENASVLNEALKPLCRRTLRGLTGAMDRLGLVHVPFFLTQNDGTVLSPGEVAQRPVTTFNSGATNSMLGGAFLCGKAALAWPQAVVVDIGGTSTDAGLLINGFPKPAPARVHVAGVPTNFQMPELVSVALGGGSKVAWGPPVRLGPSSVGAALISEALVFGGTQPTLTDAAVASNPDLCIGARTHVAHLRPADVGAVMAEARAAVQAAVESVRVSSEPLPVVLVGGGAALFGREETLGDLKVFRPPHAEVANAVGAALSRVGVSFDRVVDLASGRAALIERTVAEMTEEAVRRGVVRDSVRVVEQEDVSLPYIPGQVARLRVKVIGDSDMAHARAAFPLGYQQLSTDDDAESDEHLSSSLNTAAVTAITAASMMGGEEDIHESAPEVRDGAWFLSPYDAHCLALGAIFLGCGGGGDPEQCLLELINLLRSGHMVRVMPLSALTHLDPVRPLLYNCQMMGSPTIIMEKFVTHRQMKAVTLAMAGEPSLREGPGIAELEEGVVRVDADRVSELAGSATAEIGGVFTMEIGGLNGIICFLEAAVHGVPVIDVDCCGRAFPELQMVTPAYHGLPMHPATVADEFGNVLLTRVHTNPKALEDFFRQRCFEMGCSCSIGIAAFSVEQLQAAGIPHSMSRARHIGHEILRARKAKLDVSQALLCLLNGRLIADGKIVDVQRKTDGGFARGRVIVQCDGADSRHVMIHLQNEFLLAIEGRSGDGATLGSTPDLIVILEKSSGQPLMTTDVRYGLSVQVCVFPAPPELTIEKALETVGPSAFGYPDREYCRVGEFVPLPPIA